MFCTSVKKMMPFIHFGLTSKHTSVTLFFLGLSYGGLFENCNEMQTYCSVRFSANTQRTALTLREPKLLRELLRTVPGVLQSYVCLSVDPELPLSTGYVFSPAELN